MIAAPVKWGRSRFTSADTIFGIAFDWEKELNEGEHYRFIFRFEELPDLILIDGSIVWRRTRNSAPGGKVIIPYAAPITGRVRLTFLKDRRFRSPDYPAEAIRGGDLSGCFRTGPAKHAVKYEPYDLLSTLYEDRPPALFTNHDYFIDPLLAPDLTPPPQVDYPTMKLDILHELVEAYLPDSATFTEVPTEQQIRHQIDLIPLLEAAGINGMHLYHLTDELLEALVASRLRSFIVPTCSAGEWWGPCGGTTPGGTCRR